MVLLYWRSTIPDKNGKFSFNEIQELNAKFEAFEDEHEGDLKCEVCGNIVWSVNDHLVMMLGDSSRGLLGSRIKTPLVNYFCSHCGNMKFFSAAFWGVHIPEDDKPSSKDQKLSEGSDDGD